MGSVKERSTDPRLSSGVESMDRYGVRRWSRSARAGQEWVITSAGAMIGTRWVCASAPGPSPVVNCSRSLAAASWELAPQTRASRASPDTLIAAPWAPSTVAAAQAQSGHRILAVRTRMR